jgi:hypothetical protein
MIPRCFYHEATHHCPHVTNPGGKLVIWLGCLDSSSECHLEDCAAESQSWDQKPQKAVIFHISNVSTRLGCSSLNFSIILFGLGKGMLRELTNFSARFDLNSCGCGVWHVPCLRSSCRLPSAFCVSLHNSDWMPGLCSGKNYCAFCLDLYPLCMLSWFVSVLHATFDLYQLCTLLCDLYQLCMLSWFVSVVYSVLICISLCMLIMKVWTPSCRKRGINMCCSEFT